jgi:hypothetical protein
LYEDREKFNLQNDKAPAFMREVKKRAQKMGWDNDTQGITTYLINGENIDLIENYGIIPMNEIQDQSRPWYEHNGAQFNQRAAQNNAQMFEMLMNSISSAAKDQVAVYKDEYMLSNANANNPPELVGNGAALYKVIMRLTTLDAKSTNKSLRDVLKDLPTIATTLNGDIDAIHSYFNDAYSQLRARGEDMDDKEDILFSAYANVPDAKFQSYMEKKESDWYEDVNDMQGKDWRYIMKKAKEKYDLLKTDTHHKWGTPSLADQQIIALQAQVAALSKQLAGNSKDQHQETETESSDSDDDTASEGDGSDDESDDESSDSDSDPEDAPADISWKKVPPKDGEEKTIRKQGQVWNWCNFHAKWCIHNEQECRLGKDQDDE